MAAKQNAFDKWLADSDAKRTYHTERIEAAFETARILCHLQKGKAGEWNKLIKKASDAAVKAAETGHLDAAVETVERILAPVGKAAKKFTIYLVGHAHIDMNWQWSWPETVAVTNDTFGTVLHLMDEFPDFHFSQSQASVYAIMEEHNPDMLKRIARRVKEGRWEVAASHWVEGDKNMVSGESLCRHMLYTRSYIQELFGLSPEDVPIDWAPDTFGHAATVPTYLVRGGVKYVYLHRPGSWPKERPAAFWWKAPDKSKVLVKNDMASGYNGAIDSGILANLESFCGETGLRFTMFVYGVGDHGGGPTRRDLARAVDMASWPIFPSLSMSTSKTFFERLEKEGGKLSVVNEELNPEFTGCYTSQSLIKRGNRYNEKDLVNAEWASAAAWVVCGRKYPAGGFVEGWRDTLLSHFHDILPGSGVRDTRTYTHGLYQKTAAFTGVEETNALRSIASKIDTSCAVEDGVNISVSVPSGFGGGVGCGSVDGGVSQSGRNTGIMRHPVVVFNPTSRRRSEIVEATVWDADGTQFSVTGPDGKRPAAQVVDSGAYWGHQFVKVAFPVTVQGYGYGLYVIDETATGDAKPGVRHLGLGHHCFYCLPERGIEGLENDLVRVEIDTTTGGIRSLADGKTKTLVVEGGVLEYVVEKPHGMSSWSVDHTGPAEIPQVTAVNRKKDGPHKCSIEVNLVIRESEFTVTYELRSGDPNVYMHIKGTWFERGTPQKGVPALRMSFPFALSGLKARYEIPFGAIDRDVRDGEEVPALNWAQVTGRKGKKKAGCLLLNDCKHGHSLDGNTLRLSLIRSSYDPDPLPEIGQHDIRLALMPFSGDMPAADAIEEGLEFTNDLRVVSTDAHKGSMPASAGLVDVSPDTVIVSAIKKAEDDDAVIVRLFDPTGNKTTAAVKLNPKFFGKVTAAEEVDLLERPVRRSTAKVQGNRVSVAVPSRGIATVKVMLRSRKR